MKLKFKILDPRIGKDFEIPKYQTSGSAGLDLIACINSQLVLTPNEVNYNSFRYFNFH